ncbi:hypothetical protein SPHINGO391_360054 [Sphingomonas aurantiaca]|uniref:Uncharacterized protein n=1 Tax=Sphingomonas aurantiaca TaxID=185949 RepID=A0A5E7YDH1_9SPHN|nr:hypothetical protein SPHINGO391_360054 [Sphingomonas aurantiaca]
MMLAGAKCSTVGAPNRRFAIGGMESDEAPLLKQWTTKVEVLFQIGIMYELYAGRGDERSGFTVQQIGQRSGGGRRHGY